MKGRQIALLPEKSEEYVQLLVRRAGLLFVVFILLQSVGGQSGQSFLGLAVFGFASLAYNLAAEKTKFGKGPWDLLLNLFFAVAITAQAALFSGILFQLLLARIALRISPAKIPRVTFLLSGLYLLSAWSLNSGGSAFFWRLAYEVLVMAILAAAALYLQLVMQRNLDNVQKMQELTRNNDSIQLKAVTDELTGLYNFRAYQEKVGKLEQYALMVLDLDHFKKVNDTYGHDFGNKVLVRLGAIIHKSLRRSDLAFRYGGEEFVILLPGANAELALQVAERLRLQVAQSCFSCKGVAVPVSVSIGVAVNDGRYGEEAVFACADSALYKAKRDGRNRTELFEEELALVCRL